MGTGFMGMGGIGRAVVVDHIIRVAVIGDDNGTSVVVFQRRFRSAAQESICRCGFHGYFKDAGGVPCRHWHS